MDSIGLWVHRAEHAALCLAVVVGALLFHLHQNDVAKQQATTLVQQGLSKDDLAKFMVQQNQLVQLVRNAQGQTVATTTYVPAEGSIQVVAKNQQALLAKYEALITLLRQVQGSTDTARVQAQINAVAAQMEQPPVATATTRGWTSRYGCGFAVSPGHTIKYGSTGISLPLSPVLDWKFYYYSRWSALAQVNLFYPGIEITRHIDDYTPKFMHIENLEFGISGGPSWTGGAAGGLVLRANW